jgi:hypothetical protein
VNFDKSRVMCSNNVSRKVRHDLSQISNIKFASNLGKYLGFPLKSLIFVVVVTRRTRTFYIVLEIICLLGVFGLD